MNIVDPHWQIEHEEGQEMPIHIREKSSHPVTFVSPATRRPAAIVGVLMVLLIGFFFVHGVQTLRGQTNNGSPVTIHITEEGFNSKSISVKPGQEIQWINDDPKIPHILTSDTLSTISGLLYTDHILPGETFTTTVAADATAGTFVYISLTEDFAGEVVIATAQTKKMTQNTGSLQSPQTSLTQKHDTDNVVPPSFTAQTVSQGLIPHNPYTVGSSPTSPSGKTSPTSFQTFTSTNTPKPFRQPETGPGLWMVSLLSIGGLWWMMKKYLKNI